MKCALRKVQAASCAGLLAAAAGGCNSLIGLEVGETDPAGTGAGAPPSTSSSSAGGDDGAGAGGGDGAGGGGGAPACNQAEPDAVVAPRGLWGDTIGDDVRHIAAVDGAVTAVVNEGASLTVARWSASGAREPEYTLSVPGVSGMHVAVGAGVVYVAGESTGSATLPSSQRSGCGIGPPSGHSERPSFVAALDAAGRCSWAWSIDGDGGTAARGLAATSDVIAVAVETLGKGKTFGPCALRADVPERFTLVAAFKPAGGACAWHRELGAREAVTVRALAGSAEAGAGVVAVVGDYDAANGAVSLGGDTPVTSESRGLFVARYTSRDGAPQAVTTLKLGGAPRVAPHGAALLRGGDVAIAGNYAGTFDFQDTCPRMPDAGATDNFFVARVSGDHVVWSRGFGDATTDQTAAGVAADDAGAVYVTGLFTGEIDLGAAGKLEASAGKQAGFLIKLDAEGNLVSASKLEAGGAADLRAVAADSSSGAVYAAGSLTGILDLGLDLGQLGSAVDGPRGFITGLSSAR
ncbi:hypothetical protein SOCE26_069390 [Sorangium cellulosum]|uniref:Secreted protein n=1 Tax=Sorangium cellulosum TaxID=56 RepID=A0A2L0F1K0_SORCE|nr:hypothetical protein [Sorangium cellulosum]AUX45448.1 hypothetical protein SOCE26_069390 [Sorangium cellulosum]